MARMAIMHRHPIQRVDTMLSANVRPTRDVTMERSDVALAPTRPMIAIRATVGCRVECR